MNSDMTVHTVVTLQIRPVSDLVPHMEVVQIGIEKIRFHMICSVRNVMGKTDMCHMWAKKNQIWATFTCNNRNGNALSEVLCMQNCCLRNRERSHDS